MTGMPNGVWTLAGGSVPGDVSVANGTGHAARAHEAHEAHDAHHVTRFEQALDRAQDARDAWRSRDAVDARERHDDRPASGPARALRDGLRDAATLLDHDWAAVTGAAATSMRAGGWGPADMLALQGRMLQVSLQMDLASKLVQKSTQAVDQLVRIQ